MKTLQVTLKEDDEKLVRRLRQILETKYDKTLTMVDVVRKALETLAKAEGIAQ